MKFIKAKYESSQRPYTFKTKDDVKIGDIVKAPNGKEITVCDLEVDNGWVETYGKDKIVEVRKVEV